MKGPTYEKFVRTGWRAYMRWTEKKIDGSLLLGEPVPLTQRRANQQRHIPVVLVPGYGNSPKSMSAIGRSLQRDGFDVHYAELPEGNMGDADVAADVLERKVAAVQIKTGAKEVILVGHSRGGLVARAVAQRGKISVAKLVTLNSANEGLDLGKFEKFARPLLPEGMIEISHGSDFIEMLAATDALFAPDRFVALGTEGCDGILFPPSSARARGHEFISVDGHRQIGPFSRVTHYGVLADVRAFEAVRSVLMAPQTGSRRD